MKIQELITKELVSEVLDLDITKITEFEVGNGSIFYILQTYKPERNGLSYDNFEIRCLDYIIENCDKFQIHSVNEKRRVCALVINNEKHRIVADSSECTGEGIESFLGIKFYNRRTAILKAAQIIMEDKKKDIR